jgi:23S rRNA pseudouridine955/2504/2580 synthase/23S rRNA pseudouridine1911/1915/1917 synthase
MVVAEQGGRPSTSRWEVVERFFRFSDLLVSPLTGRTHQIRVHLAAAGMPLAVDPLYGSGRPLMLSEIKRDYKLGRGREEKALLARLPLHAWRIAFRHPSSGRTVSLEAPLPKDIAVLLKQLAKYDRPAFG